MSARRLAPKEPAPTAQAARDDPPATTPSAADDPYPLPLQHRSHPLSSDTSPDSYLAHPLDGINAVPRQPESDLSTQRARLVYQTRKRGTLETGLLISSWATTERLERMGREELTELDEILKVPEWTLYYWGIGKAQPPQESGFQSSKLLKEFQEHCKNKTGETRVMPELYNQ